jgi:hypothetical protein
VQGSPEPGENHGVVVDEEQAFQHRFSSGARAEPMGRWTKNVVPAPTSVSHQIFPWCFFTTTL